MCLRFPITNHREIRPWESNDIRHFIFNHVQFSFVGISIWSVAFIPAETQGLEGGEPPLAIKQETLPVLRPFFPCARFFCGASHRANLYYRNLGLYYGLASTPLPLYSKPRVGVADSCPSCGKPGAVGQTLLNQ